MNREHDPEPQRYYDWMLWKMRQEKKQQPRVMTQEEIYKQTIADMQHEIHALQLRVKELNDAVLQLQERKNG